MRTFTKGQKVWINVALGPFDQETTWSLGVYDEYTPRYPFPHFVKTRMGSACRLKDEEILSEEEYAARHLAL